MMRPQIDPSRRCLPVAEWPEADRMAWQAALAADDPLSFECSIVSSWKPATRHKNRRGYGRWLTFLRNTDSDLLVPPANRVTREKVAAYLAELRQQDVAPYTLRNRCMELQAVLLALAPERDWSWLRTCVVRLDRFAEDAADRSLPPLLASELVDRGLKELRHRARVPASCREAIAYRDWLMVTMLAVLPLRLRNFAALSLARHIERRIGLWRIDIEGSETKTGRPHAAFVPSDVGQFIDFYLSNIRPRLDRGAGGDVLWLSRSGTPLAEHTIYLAITGLTRHAFGTPLNPHFFRHMFATSVCIADPEAIEGARATLGHSTHLTTQHHYNRASAFTAVRTHADVVRRLRATTRRHRAPSEKGDKKDGVSI